MSDSGRGSGNRPALSRCINVSPDEFAADYWGKRPLLSTADTLERAFDDLFSSDAVDELISERGLRIPFIRMANEGTVLATSRFTASGGFGAEVADQVSSEKVLAEFAAGSTIVLQGLHRLWPPLIDFTTRLVSDLGHPAQVNAYVTPASSRGFDSHYDVHDVFVLQIAGEKRWRIHAPVHSDPLADQPWSERSDAVAEASRAEPVIDVVLRPGDSLYLPRGWIHAATALGGTSVHLTVGTSAFTRADIVQQLVRAARDSEALRASLPLGIDLSDPEVLAPIVRETVEELIAVLSRHADADGSDAAAAPNAAAPASAAAIGAALQKRFESITRPAPVRPLATVDALVALGADDLVGWRGALGGRLALRGDRVDLVARGKTLSLPASCEPALRALLDGGVLALRDLPGLDEADALVLVRRLVREGILVVDRP
jgi:lysine-specific demethylase/histidyl-hydroxylase NO66